MIVAQVSRKNKQYVSFEISGHANTAPKGSDIVCSAVSALAYTTVNSIAKLAKLKPLIEIDQEAEGYLYCELPGELSEEQKQQAQLLLASLMIGLRSIEKEYPKNLKIHMKTQ